MGLHPMQGGLKTILITSCYRNQTEINASLMDHLACTQDSTFGFQVKQNSFI